MGGYSTTEQQQLKLTFLFNLLFNALGSKRERKKLFSLVCMVIGYFLTKNAQKNNRLLVLRDLFYTKI